MSSANKGARPETVAAQSADTVEDERRATNTLDWQLLRRTWPFIRPHRFHLYLALAFLPAISLLQLVPPYLLKLAIDDAIKPGRLEALTPIVVLLVATLIGSQLVQFGHALTIQICGHRAMHDLRRATHEHLLRLNAAFFDRTPIGVLMSRLTNDVENMAEAFNSGLVTVIGDVVTLLGIVVAMLILDYRLALLTLTVLPILIVLVLIFQRLIRSAHRSIRRRIAEINASLQEHITGMKVVQILGREASAQADFEQKNRQHRDAFKASIRYDAALFALVELLGSLTLAVLIWYGGLQGIASDQGGNGITFGLLVAFIEYVQRLFGPIRDMSAKYAVMQQAMASSERVFALLDRDDLDSPRSEALPASPAQADRDATVVFDQVHFSYQPDDPVLQGLSFQLRRGQVVAVVGATGAGKSTIVRVLTRLYEIDHGAILLDGVDLRTIPVTELRRRVVVISQDVFLFAGTVLSNISLGNDAIGRQQARAAADRVGLSRLLDLDHPVLERGSNLSTGERQLVVFARALVRDPQLLVLDEATANIDPESEALIQQGIAQLLSDRTAIVIAHRLSTIENANRVIVLERGRLVEHGAHAELIKAGGLYAQLYQLQYV
jgi:ATP-binding cassette subfamily B protein